MTTRITSVAAAAACLAARACWAQSFQSNGSDIRPRVVSGKILTDAHDDHTNADIENVRVYIHAFGDDPDDPYFTQDPGFNAPAGSGLPGGGVLGYSINSSLFYWSGDTPPCLAPLPNDESLRYTFGASQRLITSTSGPQSGFALGAVASDGSFHRHLNAFLNGADGNAIGGDGVEATTGVYFVSLGVTCSGVADSDPIWMVYNNGLDANQLNAAQVYARDTFAPFSNVIGLNSPPPSVWVGDADGAWSDANRWDHPIPNAAADTAYFGGAISAPRTVTLDSPRTIGHLDFDNPNSYTIAGGAGAILTLGDGSAYADVTVTRGSHILSAPLTLASGTTFTVLPAASVLTIGGPLSAPNVSISKGGAGTLVVPAVRTQVLSICEGTVTVRSGAGPSRLSELRVMRGATLDLNDNDVVVGSATPQAAIVGAIVAARDGGAWDQGGITSSSARDQTNRATTLGVLSGAEYAFVTGSNLFDGITVGAGDTLVKYTWYGDTDFNGIVNFDDYVRIDNGFNNGLTGWLNGDFDLNGVVNFDDYVLIDLAFNTQSGVLGNVAPALASVPEPSSVVASLFLLPALFARRRKSINTHKGEKTMHRSTHRSIIGFACALVALLFVRPAFADFDVSPAVQQNRIVTGAFQDADGQFVPNVRIFGAYEFGEDIANPFFAEDPGFHPLAGSGFAGGSRVSMTVLSGLSFWDGSGAVSFAAAPAGETLLLEMGSGSLLVGNSAPAGSLTISGNVPPDGEFDEHLSSTLQGIGAADPSAGIYLLSMQLSTNQGGVAPSAPFWVLYNNGLDETAGIDAVIFAHDTFAPDSNFAGIPEPSSLGTIALAAMTLRRWRRSRRRQRAGFAQFS